MFIEKSEEYLAKKNELRNRIKEKERELEQFIEAIGKEYEQYVEELISDLPIKKDDIIKYKNGDVYKVLGFKWLYGLNTNLERKGEKLAVGVSIAKKLKSGKWGLTEEWLRPSEVIELNGNPIKLN